jgi:hypothetical protein
MMVIYTLAIIFSTIMISSGIVFWTISMFESKIKRPFLYLLACSFWPFSLTIIYTYLFLINKMQTK